MFGRLDPDFLREKALKQSRNIEGEFVPEVARLDLPGMDADIPEGRGPQIGQLHDPDRPSFDLPSQSEIDTINRTGQLPSLPDRPRRPPPPPRRDGGTSLRDRLGEEPPLGARIGLNDAVNSRAEREDALRRAAMDDPINRRLAEEEAQRKAARSGGQIGQLHEDRPPVLDLPSESDIDYFQRTGKFPARPNPLVKSQRDIARDNMRRNRAERGDRPHTPEEEEAALAWMDEMVQPEEDRFLMQGPGRAGAREGGYSEQQQQQDEVTARARVNTPEERQAQRAARERLRERNTQIEADRQLEQDRVTARARVNSPEERQAQREARERLRERNTQIEAEKASSGEQVSPEEQLERDKATATARVNTPEERQAQRAARERLREHYTQVEEQLRQDEVTARARVNTPEERQAQRAARERLRKRNTEQQQQQDEVTARARANTQERLRERNTEEQVERANQVQEQLNRDRTLARGKGGSLGERRQRREAKRRLAGQEKRDQQEEARRATERGTPTLAERTAWTSAFQDDFDSKERGIGARRGPRDDRGEMISFYEGRIERAKKEQKKNAGKKGYNPWPAQQEQKAWEQRLDDFKRNGPPLTPGTPSRDSRPMMPDRSERAPEGAGSSGWDAVDWFELPTTLPKPETARERRQVARAVGRRKGERTGMVERNDTDLIAAQARYDDLAGQRKLLQDEIDAELDRSAPNLIRVDIMREQAAQMDQDLEYAGASVEGGLVRRDIMQGGESREWGEAYDALGAAETDRAQAARGPNWRERRQMKKAERAQQDQKRRADRDAATARGREKILAERKQTLQEELNGFGWMQGDLDADDRREAALRDRIESVDKVIKDNDQVRRDSDLWMESDDERRRRLISR